MISQQINIQKSGVVLKGAGKGATTLYFVKSLTDLYGQTWSGNAWSQENAALTGRVESSPDGAFSTWMNAPGM